MTNDERKRQNQRNLAIACGIGVFIVLVYLVTLLRIGATIGAGS